MLNSSRLTLPFALLCRLDMMLQILVFQWILILVSSKQIPSYVKLCSKNNPKLGECMRETSNLLAPYLAKGIPEMDLPSIEPLDVPNISVQTAGSLIKIDADLIGCKLFNCSNFHVSHLDANLNDVTFSGNYKFPYVKATGNYKIKGNILTFAIESQGKLDFEAKNVSVDMEWYGETVSKNGNIHLKLNKIKTKIDLAEIKLYFHNLFGNNQELTDTVNNVINENIHELKKDLDDVIDKVISETSIVYYNRVYDLFTKDELFPDK